MSLITIEEWKKHHTDKLNDEFSYRITTSINEELKKRNNPPFTVIISLGRLLNNIEQLLLELKIKRILRGAGWFALSIIFNEEFVKIVFEIDISDRNVLFSHELNQIQNHNTMIN